MALRDLPFDHVRKAEDRVFLPYNTWDTILVEGAPNIITSAQSSSPIHQEISTTGIVGLRMNTAGGTIRRLWYPEYKLDYSKDIKFRIHWTSGSSDVADTINWVLLYNALSGDETAALGTVLTELNIPIPQDNVTVAFAVQQTGWGLINPNVLPYGGYFQFEVSLDAFAAGLTEDKFFLGLEIEYQKTRNRWPNYA